MKETIEEDPNLTHTWLLCNTQTDETQFQFPLHKKTQRLSPFSAIIFLRNRFSLVDTLSCNTSQTNPKTLEGTGHFQIALKAVPASIVTNDRSIRRPD
jgi:hypothetical protein